MPLHRRLLLAFALVFGCTEGAPPPALPDATVLAAPVCAGPPDGGFTTAPHASFPQVPDLGGPRVTTPMLAEVSFASDPNAARHERYAEALAASQWVLAAQEYGIGRPGLLRHTRLGDAGVSTTDLPGLRALITAAIDRGEVPGADLDPSCLVVLLYLPPALSLQVIQFSGASVDACRVGGAMHSFIERGGVRVPLAIVPRCEVEVPGLDEEGVEQYAASHEYIEGVTDPRGSISGGGWAFGFGARSPWTVLGEEVADLCGTAWVRESGAVFARLFSNEAARAGDRDPCVPAAVAGPGFGISAPQTQIDEVSPGDTVTLPVTAWSSAPMPDWTVTIEPVGPVYLWGSTDALRVNNGCSMNLRVSIPVDAATGFITGVLVRSTAPDGRSTHWPVAFSIRAR